MKKINWPRASRTLRRPGFRIPYCISFKILEISNSFLFDVYIESMSEFVEFSITLSFATFER